MLEKIFPRTLFVRSLIILIAPILLMQIVIGSVFFDSVWFKTHKALVRITAGEINTFLVLYPEFEKKMKLINLLKLMVKRMAFKYHLKQKLKNFPLKI